MNDTGLLQRYAAGEEGAFRELVGEYKDSIYAFLSRFLNRSDLVDDVFQETFLQLYVSRDTFDLSKPLRPWLFTIAANKAKDALRRRQRIDATHLGSMFDGDEYSIDDVLNTLDSDTHLPYDDLIKEETAGAVKRVIARMPAKLSKILILAYFHKFSYAEIAGILGIPDGSGTVCRRLECVDDARKRQLNQGSGANTRKQSRSGDNNRHCSRALREQRCSTSTETVGTLTLRQSLS